jgi:ABC-type transport system involved in multi-copper enzyme maturation permease subunit
MTWLTWRQFRLSALPVLFALAAVALGLAITGPQLADLFAQDPAEFFNRLGFDGPKQTLFALSTALVYAVPAVIGVFWGAPLVARELEAGTHRLVWTQSITRTRWLGVKLGVAALAALAAGLLAMAVTWWSGTLDDAVAAGYSDGSLLSAPRVSPMLFGARGILPAGLALLALALGVAAGMVLRRTVAAMAVTLIAVVAVQIVLPLVVLPHLLDPAVATASFSEDNVDGIMTGGPPGAGDATFSRIEVSLDEPGGWLLSQRTFDASGDAVITFPDWTADCAHARDAMAACFRRLNEEGYRQELSYRRASDFWPLQLVETGFVLVATAALTGFCFWRIRRDF